MKAGILCALEQELAPFLERMGESRATEKAMLRFFTGNIGQAAAAAVCCGVGKVNAAVAAQLLIDFCGVDIIINAGTSGGMDESVRLFDTVISERIAYHDIEDGILIENHPYMKSAYFEPGRGLLEAARRYSEGSPFPIRFGTMVTGDQFIADEGRERINRAFAPLCVDMETGAAAHVCYVNRIPFLAVRTVTDTAEHAGIENFEKNGETASERAAEIVSGILRLMAG